MKEPLIQLLALEWRPFEHLDVSKTPHTLNAPSCQLSYYSLSMIKQCTYLIPRAILYNRKVDQKALHAIVDELEQRITSQQLEGPLLTDRRLMIT